MTDIGCSEGVEVNQSTIRLRLDPGSLQIDRQQIGRSLRHTLEDGPPSGLEGKPGTEAISQRVSERLNGLVPILHVAG